MFIGKIPKFITNRLIYHSVLLNCKYRYNSTNPNCPPPARPKRNPGTGFGYTIGAFALVGAVTIGYAKYDDEFRKTLNSYVPGSDDFIKFVFQEEKSFMDTISEFSDSLFGDISGCKDIKPGGSGSVDSSSKIIIPRGKKDDTPYAPPRPIFPDIEKDAKQKEEEHFDEIRVEKENKEIDIGKPAKQIKPKVKVAEVKEKPQSGSDVLSSIKNISELEIHAGQTGTAAIEGYRKAEKAFLAYIEDVEILIEKSVDNVDERLWQSLKRKTDEKNKILNEAEANARQTKRDLERLKTLVTQGTFQAPESVIKATNRNIDRLLNDIFEAKERYETVKREVDLTEKYWTKVQASRQHFINELEIMFPDFDICKKQFSLQPSDLDLFVLHMYSTVIYFQKEMLKADLIGQQKLKAALEAARKGDPNFSIVETAINEGIEREKRKIAEQFQKKCLALRKESEMELRHRLKCQEQAHVDHLTEVLATREIELEREFNRRLDEHISIEQSKSKMQMAGMIARMKGMKNAISERFESDKIAHQSQLLWSACQALHRAVKANDSGIILAQQIRPLQNEVEAIKKAASENDALVKQVLNGIPQEAIERGVYPEGIIRERFLKVERVARRLALVPEGGARLPLYLLSFMQSMFLINSPNPIPQAELADEPTDFRSLDTYDILQRARYWLDRGNYAQTLKYMNLLEGASRCIAIEWMREARILLETQQAAEALMAHAVAAGLIYI